MRAIRIDVVNHKIEEVEHNGDLNEYYEHLSGDGVNCRCFTSGGSFDNGDFLMADDEGLLKNPEYFFYIENVTPYPIAGHALIVGTDEEGETVDVKTKIDDIRVSFLTGLQAKLFSLL